MKVLHDAICLRSVSFAYPTSPPLMRDVSLTVPQGGMLALLGANGSGKTTLLRILFGALRADGGSVRVCGCDPARTDRRQFARSVAVVGSQPELGFPYTAVEVVLMGRAPHVEGFRLESEVDVAAACEAMRVTGIEFLAERPFDSLSSGERQRVCVARALAQQPKVLLLDEPASHLDIKQQVMLYELLVRLNREDGLTVVSVLHDLNLAALYFETVAMLKAGALFAVGPPEQVITYANVREVFDTDVYVARNDLTGKLNVLPLPVRVDDRSH